MIHPLIIAIVLADMTSVVLLFAAALRAEPVVRRWDPGSASAGQLQLERQLEAASLLARLGAAILVLSTVGLAVALTLVLPGLVPGAMCGTGVVEAAQAEGPLLLRGFAVLAIGAWSTLDALDRSHPRAPLARPAALVLLPVAPLAAAAAWRTAGALGRLDGQAVVDCCASMYADAAAATAGAHPMAAERAFSATTDLGLFGIGALLLAIGGLYLMASSRRPGIVWVAAIAGLTFAWAIAASDVLVQHLAAYHYEVLAHHCPWCLFLPEHGAVGYVLYGILGLALYEAGAALVVALALRASPSLELSGHRRLRRAGAAITVAVAVFVVVASAPAITWWVQFGVRL